MKFLHPQDGGPESLEGCGHGQGDLVGVEAVLQLAIHLRYGLQRHMKSQFKKRGSLSIRKNPNSTQIRKIEVL